MPEKIVFVFTGMGDNVIIIIVLNTALPRGVRAGWREHSRRIAPKAET
jgi:hypothetical protein